MLMTYLVLPVFIDGNTASKFQALVLDKSSKNSQKATNRYGEALGGPHPIEEMRPTSAHCDITQLPTWDARGGPVLRAPLGLWDVQVVGFRFQLGFSYPWSGGGFALEKWSGEDIGFGDCGVECC